MPVDLHKGLALRASVSSPWQDVAPTCSAKESRRQHEVGEEEWEACFSGSRAPRCVTPHTHTHTDPHKGQPLPGPGPQCVPTPTPPEPQLPPIVVFISQGLCSPPPEHLEHSAKTAPGGLSSLPPPVLAVGTSKRTPSLPGCPPCQRPLPPQASWPSSPPPSALCPSPLLSPFPLCLSPGPLVPHTFHLTGHFRIHSTASLTWHVGKLRLRKGLITVPASKD